MKRNVRTLLALVLVVLNLTVPTYLVAGTISPEGRCTRDINNYGNPSVCECQGGYDYDKRDGQCHDRKVPSIAMDQKTTPFYCTKDINAHGHASICVCASGYVYSEVTGRCNFTPL